MGQFGDAVLDRSELQPQRLRQALPDLGLIEKACRSSVGVEEASVQGSPAAVAALSQVGDEDVGMELRVKRPRGAMSKAGSDEAGRLNLRLAAGSAPAPSGLFLQVTDGLFDRLFMGLADLFRDLRRAERPEQADRLGCAEGGVPAGYAAWSCPS